MIMPLIKVVYINRLWQKDLLPVEFSSLHELESCWLTWNAIQHKLHYCNLYSALGFYDGYGLNFMESFSAD